MELAATMGEQVSKMFVVRDLISQEVLRPIINEKK